MESCRLPDGRVSSCSDPGYKTHKGRWGDGLTAEDMRKCVWVRPELVAQIEFLEWTDSDHLRHSKFAGFREDKDARRVVKEHGGEIDLSFA
jgi:ATP-dependent DNA ligase